MINRSFSFGLLLFSALFFIQGCSDSSDDEMSSSEGLTQEELNAMPDSAVNAEEKMPELGSKVPEPQASSAPKVTEDGYQEMSWEDLVPAGAEMEKVLEKYQDQIDKLSDNDEKANALFDQIQAELDRAPVDETLNGKKVKIPGYVAPLEENEQKVTEFLLVPYFGACIHVPPPPLNQTVMVKVPDDQGIPVEKLYEPYWVKGVLKTQMVSTEIGDAGYNIDEAVIESYLIEEGD